MGPPSGGHGSDYQEFTPFNSTEHYHGTLDRHCSAGGAQDQHTREVCWLANLGDLRQEDPFVARQLISWMAGLQAGAGVSVSVSVWVFGCAPPRRLRVECVCVCVCVRARVCVSKAVAWLW